MTPVAPGADLGLSTPANLITLARLGASPLLFWLILGGDGDGASWAAVGVALAFAASDAVDGYLARSTGTVTRAGAFLDPLADKVVVLGSMACLAAAGRIGWPVVALIGAREVWMSLFRVRCARRGVSVPARRSAKWKVVVQGAAVILTLLPPLAATESLATERLLRAVWIVAVAFTLATGLAYLYDARRARRVEVGCAP